jgi:hypothetical protein
MIAVTGSGSSGPDLGFLFGNGPPKQQELRWDYPADNQPLKENNGIFSLYGDATCQF